MYNLKSLLSLISIVVSCAQLSAQIRVDDRVFTVEDCIKEAEALESMDSIIKAAEHLNAAAFYNWKYKNLDKAIELYRRSLALYEKINAYDSHDVIEHQVNLGLVYAEKGDYESALRHLKSTLESREHSKEKTRITVTKINIAIVLNRLKSYDEALTELHEALNLAGEINDREHIRTCYTLLSETYGLKGDKKSSMIYYDYYKATLSNIQKDHVKYLHTALEKIQDDREFIQDINQSQNKQYELQRYDSANKVLIQHISNLKLQLQLLEKEESLNFLHLQETEKELEQGRILIAIIGIILLITLILLFVVAATLRKNKRMNRILTDRNELISSQKTRLIEGNKVRTRLLSILSHDLRSLLSGIHLMVQMLRSKSLPQEKIDKHLIKLDESLNISFQMLENMLYWSKNQMTGIVCNRERIDLTELTVGNLKLLESHIQDKKIEIDNLMIYHDEACADKEMVNIIIRNLISNAVKFTPKDGKITISSRKYKDNILLTVEDNGIGMSEEIKSKIFKSEIKSKRGTDNENGSGLGLELCYEFAMRCGGNLTFESELGQGSKFTLTLPAAFYTVCN